VIDFTYTTGLEDDSGGDRDWRLGGTHRAAGT
jgi:hypothetical protein